MDNYLDWPQEVSLETYAKCNAACTFCPYTTLDRIGERMSDAMIDSVIDQLRAHPHAFFFSPFKVNEPFLDKRLMAICRKVNATLPKAFIRLFTNGSALTAKHVAEVAALDRVAHLWCSLNEVDSGEYKALMGLDFERTAANLDHLHNEVLAGRFTHPVDLSRVSSLDGSRNDEFHTYCFARWPLFNVHVLKRDGWLGAIDPSNPDVPDRPCPRWWELSIMANGKAALCCMDGAGDYVIGDLTYQTLYDIYNSEAWRANRVKLWSRRNVSPCSRCTYG